MGKGNKGRLVLDVWKDHEADPFFCVELEGVKDPYKVYYGREAWIVDLNKRETRAKYAVDREMKDPSRVISSIEISGPMDEILVLIEYAGYHGCAARARPEYIRAPRRVLAEMYEHVATLFLQEALAENDPQRITLVGGRFCSPLQRETRYNNMAYPDRWGVVTGRHRVIDVTRQEPRGLLVVNKS